MNDLEDPRISFPPQLGQRVPVCPCCGSEESEDFYFDREGRCVGCDSCIHTVSWDQLN